MQSVGAGPATEPLVFQLSLPLVNPAGVTVIGGGRQTRALFEAEDKSVRSKWPATMGEILGPEGALLTLQGEEHRAMRRAMAGAISPGVIEAPANWANLQRVVASNLDAWVGAAEGGEEPLDMLLSMRQMAFEVAVTQTLGTDAELSREKLVSLREDFDAITEGLFVPKLSERLGPLGELLELILFPERDAALKGRMRIDAALSEHMCEVLERARHDESVEGDGMAGRVALAGMAEGVSDVSLPWMLGFAVNMLFGGVVTTAASLYRMTAELAAMPEILELLRADVAAAMPVAAARAREGAAIEEVVAAIEPAGVAASPLLNAVLLETLRYFPVVPFAFREVIADDLVVGGHSVPKGHTAILFFGGAINEERPDGGVWDDAAVFDPRRWLPFLSEAMPGKSISRNPKPFNGAFAPFGAGPRVCPGQSLALAELSLHVAALALCADWDVLPGRYGGDKVGQSPGEYSTRVMATRNGLERFPFVVKRHCY